MNFISVTDLCSESFTLSILWQDRQCQLLFDIYLSTTIGIALYKSENRVYFVYKSNVVYMNESCFPSRKKNVSQMSNNRTLSKCVSAGARTRVCLWERERERERVWERERERERVWMSDCDGVFLQVLKFKCKISSTGWNLHQPAKKLGHRKSMWLWGMGEGGGGGAVEGAHAVCIKGLDYYYNFSFNVPNILDLKQNQSAGWVNDWIQITN